MIKLILIITAIMLSVCTNAYSVTTGYLLYDKGIVKIDTNTDTIIERIKAPDVVKGSSEIENNKCAIDIYNHILLRANTDKFNGIYVYDLITLKNIQFVAVPPNISKIYDIQIFYPKLGNYFYVTLKCLDADGINKVYRNFRYDKLSYTNIVEVVSFINDSNDKTWISEESNTIIVFTQGNQLKQYNAVTLDLIKSDNLSNIFMSGTTGKSIEDISNNTLLLSERKSETNKVIDNYFTYSIISKNISAKIIPAVTNISDALFIDNNKVVIKELEYNGNLTDMLITKDKITSVAIHIYDINIGNKLASLKLPYANGELLGVHPDGSKIYLLSVNENDLSTLFVYDANNLSLIKKFVVPDIEMLLFVNE